MYFTLGEAAKEAGKAKSTISKYIKNGKMSYVSKDADGYKIDPAELFRVFPKETPKTVRDERLETPSDPPETPNNSKLLELEVKFLTEQVHDLKERLDVSEERYNEERNDRLKITALIASQHSVEPSEDKMSEPATFLPWVMPPIFIIAFAAIIIAARTM